mgnify:FL=1
MDNVIVFGNSGSGKSTYAKVLVDQGFAHLDLDTLAWDMTPDPVRRPLSKSLAEINTFIKTHNKWVIEGCYADLIENIMTDDSELVFMNLSVEQCIENAKNRPWESHKYESKEQQDQNLKMLIDYIIDYPNRDNWFSLSEHTRIYTIFKGPKKMITENDEAFNG